MLCASGSLMTDMDNLAWLRREGAASLHRPVLRMLAILWLALLLATLLAACGGGGDEPQCDDATPPSTNPVDCHLHPELCA